MGGSVVEKKEFSRSSIAFSVFLIFFGCGTNVFSLEFILQHDKGCGPLVTVAQFSFIALIGFIQHLDPKKYYLWLRPNTIPLKFYIVFVTLFYSTSIINNNAYDYHIGVPLHTIFRSGSLVASLIVGVIVLKKRYSIMQLTGIFAVTVGIIISVLSSVPETEDSTHSKDDFWTWCYGIFMLTTALFLSALLGVTQEYVYSKHDKNWQESMFYNHLFSLPLFAVYFDSIQEHVHAFEQCPVVMSLPGLTHSVSSMWVYLFINISSQYVCIMGVYSLSVKTPALTTTLAITVRKFLSLIVSILYFGNDFTPKHWLGTLLVFGGTLLYVHPSASAKKQKEKET